MLFCFHYVAISTPTQPEPETPEIVAATDPLEESLTNPLEKSLTRSQIERQKPKPPKIFVSKAHVMAGDDKEISLYLGQKVEVCVCMCVHTMYMCAYNVYVCIQCILCDSFCDDSSDSR